MHVCMYVLLLIVCFLYRFATTTQLRGPGSSVVCTTCSTPHQMLCGTTQPVYWSPCRVPPPLSRCVCVCVCVCVCLHGWWLRFELVCAFAFIDHACLRTYLHMCVRTYVYNFLLYKCTLFINMYICMYVHRYTCVWYCVDILAESSESNGAQLIYSSYVHTLHKYVCTFVHAYYLHT